MTPMIRNVLAATLLASLGYANPAVADDRLRCESTRGREQWCDADTRHGVRFVRQLSSAPCYEGDTWGYSRRGIWVSNGCRAEFEVQGGRRGGSDGSETAAAIIGLALLGAALAHDDDDDERRYRGNVVRCESRDRRQNYCSANTRRASVQVLRQLSNARCSYGYSWGYDRRGIWVSNGCRADFEIIR